MSDWDAWLLLYAGIVSIKAHPRNEGELDLAQCARLADQAFKLAKERDLCRGLPP